MHGNLFASLLALGVGLILVGIWALLLAPSMAAQELWGIISILAPIAGFLILVSLTTAALVQAVRNTAAAKRSAATPDG